MWIESVVLEHHRDIAIPREDIVQDATVEIDFPSCNFFQASDHPQGGGLAASGRTQEHDELAVMDGQDTSLTASTVPYFLLRFSKRNSPIACPPQLSRVLEKFRGTARRTRPLVAARLLSVSHRPESIGPGPCIFGPF
jgi:hypothetical protein